MALTNNSVLKSKNQVLCAYEFCCTLFLLDGLWNHLCEIQCKLVRKNYTGFAYK